MANIVASKPYSNSKSLKKKSVWLRRLQRKLPRRPNSPRPREKLARKLLKTEARKSRKTHLSPRRAARAESRPKRAKKMKSQT